MKMNVGVPNVHDFNEMNIQAMTTTVTENSITEADMISDD